MEASVIVYQLICWIVGFHLSSHSVCAQRWIHPFEAGTTAGIVAWGHWHQSVISLCRNHIWQLRQSHSGEFNAGTLCFCANEIYCFRVQNNRVKAYWWIKMLTNNKFHFRLIKMKFSYVALLAPKRINTFSIRRWFPELKWLIYWNQPVFPIPIHTTLSNRVKSIKWPPLPMPIGWNCCAK